jgi:hypothetical protein
VYCAVWSTVLLCSCCPVNFYLLLIDHWYILYCSVKKIILYLTVNKTISFSIAKKYEHSDDVK